MTTELWNLLQKVCSWVWLSETAETDLHWTEGQVFIGRNISGFRVKMKNLQITYYLHTHIQKNVCKSYTQHSTSCIVYLQIKLCTHFINSFFPSTKAETLCKKGMQHNSNQRDNSNLGTAAKHQNHKSFLLLPFFVVVVFCLWPVGTLGNWEGAMYLGARGGRLPQTPVSLPGRGAVTGSCENLLIPLGTVFETA